MNQQRKDKMSGKDLGSSTDRAMFTDRDSAESRSSGEQGMGPSGERGMGGGISSREECEQEQPPERGRSKPER